MTKWFAGIMATVIAGVLIFWFTEGLRQPTPPYNPPPGVAPGNPPSGPSVIGGPITVMCSANPHVLQPGNQTELVIQVISSQNTPVSNANVRVSSGGGTFTSSGSTTVIGRTDYSGSFRTIWRSPSPAAKGYVMGVTVSKQGFIEGRGECRTLIQ
jgi:hypothetical protein